MTFETFFDKFDQFADAPNAVAKLRELVLELAVRGQLSYQSDEDIEDLEWRELALKINMKDTFLTLDRELPFVIPFSWIWTTLDTLGDTKPKNTFPDDTKSSFVPMSLISANYGEVVRHEVRNWGEIKKGFTHFKNGDVVLAKITPCFENGKSAVINNLTGGVGSGTTELHVFRCNNDMILPEFVIIYFKTRGFIRRGISLMTGSAGQKRVPHDYFAKSPFPLPPLAEQRRIVAKVDELMALCDRLEAQLQARETQQAALARAALARFADAPTPANLELLFHPAFAVAPADLRKSILTLAVQGKLVPQDPEDESVEDFLHRIWTNQLDNRLKLTDADKTQPFDLPTHWRWVVLAEIAEFSMGKTPPRGDSNYWQSEDHNWVSIADMKHYGTITETKEKVSKLAAQEIFRQRFVEIGSILMSFKLTIGKVARAGIQCFHNEAIISLKPPEPALADYLFWFLPIFSTLQTSNNAVKGSTLNKGLLILLPIALPPLAEQRRIVAKVDELMALVDQLEAQLATARTRASQLLDAMIAELTAP